MRLQEHVKFSSLAALVAAPWLKQDVLIPLVASIGIDVDHYLWHVVKHRNLSLRAAVRYYGQPDPPQLAQQRLLHHPFFLGALLVLGVRQRSRLLLLVLSGLLFHVSLDVIHNTQMKHLKRSLSEGTQGKCTTCGKEEALQLHTVHVSSNPFVRYSSRNFVVLCPACHEQVHKSPPRHAESAMSGHN